MENEYSKLHKLLTRVLPFVASAVVGACLVLGGYAVNNIGQDANNACQASNKVADAMTDILQDAQNQTRRTPPQTLKEDRRRAALKFYDDSIKKLKDAKC